MESHSQWVYESLTFFQLITGVASTVGVIHPFLESMGVRHFIYSRKGFLERLFKLSGKGALWIFLHFAHILFMNTNVHGRHVLWEEAEDAWVDHAWRRRGSEGTSRLSATSWGDAGLWSLMSGYVGLAKAVPGRFRLDIRKNVCTRRVVKHWDWLPGEVVVDNALKSML